MTNNKDFNKGLLFAALGSFWWGFIGVIYFKYISFAGHIEVVIHRCLWTTVMLIVTSIFFSKIHSIKKILSEKKKINFTFFFWFTYIYKLERLDICSKYRSNN